MIRLEPRLCTPQTIKIPLSMASRHKSIILTSAVLQECLTLKPDWVSCDDERPCKKVDLHLHAFHVFSIVLGKKLK